MGDSLPFFPCDFITVVERVERLMGKIPFQFLRGGVEQDKPLDREFVVGQIHGVIGIAPLHLIVELVRRAQP